MCRYGSPVYWTRDDNAGVWHPTTDYPAVGFLPTSQPSKSVQAAASTASGTATKMEGVVQDPMMTVDATALELSQVSAEHGSVSDLRGLACLVVEDDTMFF